MNFHTTISSNIDAVIAEVTRLPLPEDEYTGQIVNDTPYARYLHDRVGYWVMNDSVLAAYFHDMVGVHLGQAAARGLLMSEADMRAAFVEALDLTVDYYTSVIGTKSTPGKVKPPPRPMHPGAWADDTEQLVRSYVTYLRAGGRILEFDARDHPAQAA